MEWQPSIQALSLTPETTLPSLMFTPLTSWGAIEYRETTLSLIFRVK
ncbi:hypothetical protein JCM19235_752 [Vibrio maritimus]|uniref:Uncharacterized protein n=1 Tax=Vibrio maritimus TaxID=990268 RepID=A0A090RVT6_9VIBR|nr:hypothetical protein JCM19235_752 [Vibrio maritimus]